MESTSIGIRAHSLIPKKKVKPLAICLTALFLVSMIAVFSPLPVRASSATLSLHTSGSQILDSNNQPVQIREIGMAGFAPDIYFWSPSGSDNWGDQWSLVSTTQMDQTFQAMQTTWHVNAVRMFYFPEWFWENTIYPSQLTPGASPATESAVAGIETILAEAAKYGIYVDLVPYQLTTPTTSYTSDGYGYMSNGIGCGQGMPLDGGWDSAGSAFIASTGMSEANFWQAYYTKMATDLLPYNNVIFEAWNEPGNIYSTNSVDAGYQQYLTIMYNAIRAAGNPSLIEMQWMNGWYPNGFGMNLAWAKGIVNSIGNPTNLVFTTHFYWYAPTDLTSYWTNYQNFQGATSIQDAIAKAQASMGVSYPFVINEQGSSSAVSANIATDQAWYKTVLTAEDNLNLGMSGYFWVSDAGLGPCWTGETMLSTGTNYTPNIMGQEFINSYVAPSPSPTPSTTPTPSPTPTPIPTATPTPSPTPTPKPTATPTPTSTPTPSPTPTPTATPKPTASPDPTPTTSPTPSPSQQPTATATPKPTVNAPSPTPTSKPTTSPASTPTSTPKITSSPKPTKQPRSHNYTLWEPFPSTWPLLLLGAAFCAPLLFLLASHLRVRRKGISDTIRHFTNNIRKKFETSTKP
jgi:hypothetical protein